MASDGPRDTDSSDASYDSEEERYLARQQRAARTSALRADQAAQAHLLQGFRARQEQHLQLEQAALAAKLRKQQGPTGSIWEREGVRDGRPLPCRPAGCAGDDAPRSWIRKLLHHERCWEALQQRSTALEPIDDHASARSLAFVDVPWPPLECAAYLRGLAHLEQQHGHKDGQRRAARRAYAHACRRWHPDKFVARWGPLLAPPDRGAILQQVQQLSQGINEAWEVQRQEWEAVTDAQ